MTIASHLTSKCMKNKACKTEPHQRHQFKYNRENVWCGGVLPLWALRSDVALLEGRSIAGASLSRSLSHTHTHTYANKYTHTHTTHTHSHTHIHTHTSNGRK